MKLVYHRGPEDVLYSFFWINDQRQQVSPIFHTEDDAKQWLIKSVSTTEDKPPVKPKPEVKTDDRYQEGFNAGKLFAELEYVEKTQEILELIADARSEEHTSELQSH